MIRYIAREVWHTNNRKREIVAFIEEFVDKKSIFDGDVEVEEGRVLTFVFAFNLQFWWVYILTSGFELTGII